MNLSLLLMLVMFVGMMFFTQRQQQKQAKKRQEQLNQLKRGDEIVTIGGMFAVIDEVDLTNNRVVLDVDGVYLTFELSAIKQVLSNTATAEPEGPEVGALEVAE